MFGGAAIFAPLPHWELALEYQRYDYSDTNAFGNSLDRVFQGHPLGSSDGPGFGWRSQNAYKLGVRYQATHHLVLRAGFIYATAIVPRSQTLFAPLAPATSQLHYTGGFSFAISRSSELSGYAALAPKTTIGGEDSIPTALGGGEVNSSFRGISYGLSYGWRLGVSSKR